MCRRQRKGQISLKGEAITAGMEKVRRGKATLFWAANDSKKHTCQSGALALLPSLLPIFGVGGAHTPLIPCYTLPARVAHAKTCSFGPT